MPWPIYPREKSPQNPLDRKLGGLQSQSRPGGDPSNILYKINLTILDEQYKP
jgi:hypothetical protein